MVIKLIIIGDENTGKTTTIKHHLTGIFDENYKPTNGVEIHPITLKTNKGKIIINAWDISGNTK